VEKNYLSYVGLVMILLMVLCSFFAVWRTSSKQYVGPGGPSDGGGWSGGDGGSHAGGCDAGGHGGGDCGGGGDGGGGHEVPSLLRARERRPGLWIAGTACHRPLRFNRIARSRARVPYKPSWAPILVGPIRTQ
jgi:hypothetical protein